MASSPSDSDAGALLEDSTLSERPLVPGRPRLLVLAGPLLGQQFSLDAEETVVGRGADVSIVIKEQLLSREHASFVRVGRDTWAVRDKNSKNGTYVNNRQVSEQTLRYGDQIRLGSSVFLFTHYSGLEDGPAQKRTLEMLGRLGAGVAHEFNNLLAVLVACQAYLDTLPRTQTLADPDVRECLEDMRASVQRASSLTGQLLGATQHGEQRFGCTNVAVLCSDVAELVRRTVPRSIEIQLEVTPALHVVGDRNKLHQLLFNLCINARDAMPDGGILKITGKQVRGEDCAASRPLAGTQVQLSVSDTGLGMSDETRRRVFEPFFTTKGDGQGTGLGLTSVLEAVGYHGGQIMFDTTPGGGTTFHVLLPAVSGFGPDEVTASESMLPLPDAFQPDTFGTRARILVVDDDPFVRRGTGRLLDSLGYQVSYAASGREGVERYTEARHDAVLLDLDMPDMGGIAAAEAIRRMDANARVVFISGHWRAEETLAEPDASLFLQKPCSVPNLRRALEAALAAPAMVTHSGLLPRPNAGDDPESRQGAPAEEDGEDQVDNAAGMGRKR